MENQQHLIEKLENRETGKMTCFITDNIPHLLTRPENK